MSDSVGYSSLARSNRNCEKSCKSWIKTFLLFFNIILMIISIAVFGWCIYFFKYQEKYFSTLEFQNIFIAYYLSISAAVVLFIITILGFVAISKNMPNLLITYVVIIAIIMLLEAGTVFLSIYYSSFFYVSFTNQMKDKMINEYLDKNTEIVKAVDDLQIQYKCCGAYSYYDWKDSKYIKSQKSIQVPQSCCKSKTSNCGAIVHPSNINVKGCSVRLYEAVKKKLIYIEYIGVGCFSGQLIAVIMGTILIIFVKKDIQKRKEFRPNYKE